MTNAEVYRKIITDEKFGVSLIEKIHNSGICGSSSIWLKMTLIRQAKPSTTINNNEQNINTFIVNHCLGLFRIVERQRLSTKLKKNRICIPKRF